MTKNMQHVNADGRPILPIGETWQFFSAGLELLGMPFILKTYGPRKQRQFYKWAADPRCCEETARNPLDRLKLTLKGLMTNGELGRSVARQVVAMLADVVGFDLVPKQTNEPDKDTIDAECLDDYPPLTAFHHAIKTNAEPAIVRAYFEKAKDELAETYTKWQEEN